MRLLNFLLRDRHGRRARHLESCAPCRQQLRRERQYLERLRGADIPQVSEDFTARLLARTGDLARAGEADGPEQPAPARGSTAGRGVPSALRSAVLAAGGAAAAAALLGGAAYLMGGDTAPLAGGAPASAFVQRDLSDPLPAAAGPGGGAPAGWSLTGEPDFTPAGALTAAQLAALRSDGWTCPELRELGYHLVWARGGVLSGADIVELRLTDGRNFATVLEQHSPQEQQRNVPPAPVNVLTGRPAASDGFTAEAVPGGVLWVNRGTPFAAIYQAGGATFTYVSDQPAELADDGVAALVRAGAAPVPEGAGAGTVPGHGAAPGAVAGLIARLERGLGRILELPAP